MKLSKTYHNTIKLFCKSSIEILWKFIKYEWIEVDAYASWSRLIKYLKKVLENLGQEYAINFV